MKKTLIFLGFVSLIALCSCSKDSTVVNVKPDPVEEAIIGAIFNVGNSGLSNVGPAMAPTKNLSLRAVTTDYPINQALNYSQAGEAGGTVSVTGAITGSMSDTGNSTMVMNMTEAFQNYGLTVDSKPYTSTGSILYKGNISMSNANNANITMTANFTIGGSLTIVGANYNKTTAMQLAISENVKGTSISMSVTGTVGGKAVNYSETMNMQ